MYIIDIGFPSFSTNWIWFESWTDGQNQTDYKPHPHPRFSLDGPCCTALGPLCHERQLVQRSDAPHQCCQENSRPLFRDHGDFHNPRIRTALALGAGFGMRGGVYPYLRFSQRVFRIWVESHNVPHWSLLYVSFSSDKGVPSVPANFSKILQVKAFTISNCMVRIPTKNGIDHRRHNSHRVLVFTTCLLMEEIPNNHLGCILRTG